LNKRNATFLKRWRDTIGTLPFVVDASHTGPFVTFSVNVTLMLANIAAKRSILRDYLTNHYRPYYQGNSEEAHKRFQLQTSEDWLVYDLPHRCEPLALSFCDQFYIGLGSLPTQHIQVAGIRNLKPVRPRPPQPRRIGCVHVVVD
jgi:hypothetical protein